MAFSSFKMAVGETPGQGCWNTPRIVEYFVTWHMIKWLLRRLFPASGSPVSFLAIWNRCSNKTKTFHRVLRDKILTNFWSHLAALARGFSNPPFGMWRRPWERGWAVCRRHIDFLPRDTIMAAGNQWKHLELTFAMREITFPSWASIHKHNTLLILEVFKLPKIVRKALFSKETALSRRHLYVTYWAQFRKFKRLKQRMMPSWKLCRVLILEFMTSHANQQ